MKKLLVLGGGTAGTMSANRLAHQLKDWKVTVIDRDDNHRYQPGFLFMPFGTYAPDQVTRSRRDALNKNVDLILGEVDRIDGEANKVLLENGTEFEYDYLIIATGVGPRPDQTDGLASAIASNDAVHEFYSYEGSMALAEKLKHFEGGNVVINIVEMPIKCPVAPLEFAFLADDFFTSRGIREKVTMTYVTPLGAAFTQPIAAQAFGATLDEKSITVEPDYMLMEVDNDANEIVSFDERRIPFDLLVSIPVNMGQDFLTRSGLGNELNLVPVDKFTQLSNKYSNVFALGDANNIPTSKAGSVAHFEVDIFVENFMEHIAGKEMTHRFDGHANCFIETGGGKAMLIDFNYNVEPLPGKYPYPIVGPMSLLKKTRVNHMGKMAFRWMYWNILMPGHQMPVPAHMSLSGKDTTMLDEAQLAKATK
ncbi:MAG: NAD(P)/FAD-dependent oxidoreductase [Actinomycetales bacterium]|nr:NAD(P)/FAD-dependent oxidoreductase [Actinomycetales bacterium]